MSRKRTSLRFWLVFALAFALLLIGAVVVVPAVIGRAYRGESLSFLNGIIAGRDYHPVEFYLDAWNRLARKSLTAIGVTGLGAYVWWLIKPHVAEPVGRLLRGDLAISPARAIWLAGWFGAWMGLIEASHLAIRYLIERHPADGFTWPLVWMGPIASTLSFLLFGILLLLVVRLLVTADRALSPVSLPAVVLPLGLAAFYGLLQDPQLRLASYAVVLLSLGLAVSLFRVSRSRSQGFLKFARRTTPVMAIVLLAGLTIGLLDTPSHLEARRLAKLPAAQPGLPNVLLIILDTARAKSMSLYGYERPTTPNLEQFATRGVTFDRAIATSSWTLPSHASMFTGRLPFELSVDMEVPLDDTYPTLAEILDDVGYATAGFAANYAYTSRASGLSRGFARYEDFRVSWRMFLKSSWASRRLVKWLGYQHPADRLLARRGDHWRVGLRHAGPNTEDFLNWMSTRRPRPFFVFLNYFDAHAPYYSPPPFRRMFASPGLSTARSAKTRPVTEEEMNGMRAAYDAAIAYTDHHLGRIFEALEDAGIMDNTIVIITADHGELFGEHRLRGHYTNLYMPALRVPLVIVYPKRIAPASRVTRAVSLRDIPATVLELISGRPDSRLPGETLSRFWFTEDPGTPATRQENVEMSTSIVVQPNPVLAETNPSPAVDILDWEPLARGPMKSLVIGDFHYILNGDGVEELYNLSQDSDEEHDLSATPEMATVLERARSQLDSIVSH